MDPPFGIGLADWDSPVSVDMLYDWLQAAFNVCTNSNVVLFICVDVQLNWKLGSALAMFQGGLEVSRIHSVYVGYFISVITFAAMANDEGVYLHLQGQTLPLGAYYPHPLRQDHDDLPNQME
jgi:hypothetical protein